MERHDWRGGPLVTVAVSDVLRPASWSRAVSRHWRGVDLRDVAIAVSAAAGLNGQLLPYTRVDGRPAFPFVLVDEDAAAERLRSSQGPILDRTRLRDYAASGFVDAPPQAVALSGFVTVEPWPAARRHLAGLRTWAPTVAAVPSWRPLDAVAAAECDYYGHRVYISDGFSAAPLEMNASSHRPAVRGPDAWGRLRDEQMFQLALESGLVPC